MVALALALLSTIRTLGQYYAFCALLGVGAFGRLHPPHVHLDWPIFLSVARPRGGLHQCGDRARRLHRASPRDRPDCETGNPWNFLVLSACMAIPFLLTLVVVQGESRRRTAAPCPRAARPRPGNCPHADVLDFWHALFFSAHAMLGVQQNLISYLTGEHVSPAQAALILGIALAAAAPGKLISGILADKVTARAGMIFSVICVALGILALLNTAPQSDMMYWLAMVFGMGYGGIFNAAPTIIFEYFGTHQVGKALGLFYVFFGLGTASGGELAGHLFDETHRWSVPFTVDLSLACVGAAAAAGERTHDQPCGRTGQSRSLRLLKPYDRQT